MAAMDNAARKLPEEFAFLQEYDEWAIPDEYDRLGFREGKTMDIIRDFYDSMLPHVENIFAYFKRIDGEGNSLNSERALEASNLMNLMYALSDAALSVELHKSPTVPDGMPWHIWKPEHENPDWKNKPKIRLFSKEKRSE